MQPLDALTLFHLAGELDLKLADGKINKIQQASHHELLLSIWTGGEAGKRKFYINIHPENAYCAIVSDTSFLTFPDKPPSFCMLLRKHLVSARIRQIKTLPDDRVLNIYFDNFNEIGQSVHPVLSIELMGKNSNIILYDEELKMILGCAHGVSEEMSSFREISSGYPYIPPPRPPRMPLRTIIEETWIKVVDASRFAGESPEDVLTQTYMGVGKATLKDIFENSASPVEAYGLLMDLFKGIHLYPAIRRDGNRYSLLAAHQHNPEWNGMDSVNRMIQTFYTSNLTQSRIKSLQKRFMQIVKTQDKKLQKREEELGKLDRQAIEGLKKTGDLLTLAHSQNLQSSGSHIDLVDYDTGEQIKISIDPKFSLADNAQLYYRRYKKAQARLQKASEDSENIKNMRWFIDELYVSIDLSGCEADLLSIQEDLEAQGWIKSSAMAKKKKQKSFTEPVSFISSDGFTILVGRNSMQNEQIVGKIARTDDLWFHAHLVPGSHVLIKTEKKEVSDSTLLEAALLAAYFSKARHSVNVPVIYTEARHVRKIPRSYPGHVTYTGEKAVNVTPSYENMEKLLDLYDESSCVTI